MESMNIYVAPQYSYSFLRGDDELCFQTSLPHHMSHDHSQIIQGMHLNHPPMYAHTSHNDELPSTLGKDKKLQGAPINIPAADGAKGDEISRSSKRKKTVHRDVERQRRHEMSVLYMLLRSQLPVEFLKGKRSISDHMSEAANYINHLKAKIQELTEKRDQMRRLVASSSNSVSLQTAEKSSPSPHISVRATLNGAAVVVVSKLGHELLLSQVIAALVEEGLNVVSIFTCKNEQSVYSVECESDGSGVNSSNLEQKLRDSIGLSN